MEHNVLALHETMEIHELLNFKTICMTMSKLSQGVVFDQELKSLLDRDTKQSVKDAGVLQGLLDKTQPGGVHPDFLDPYKFRRAASGGYGLYGPESPEPDETGLQ
jgi:similar to spore coat protein